VGEHRIVVARYERNQPASMLLEIAPAERTSPLYRTHLSSRQQLTEVPISAAVRSEQGETAIFDLYVCPNQRSESAVRLGGTKGSRRTVHTVTIDNRDGVEIERSRSCDEVLR